MNRFKPSRVQTAEPGRRPAYLWQKCSWRTILVVAVTFALAFAVATRFTDYSSLVAHTTRSVAQYDLGTKRQHIDKSTFTWIFSLADCSRLELPPLERRLALPHIPLFKVLDNQSLYNRPPPVSS
jgi:hypothetical protein